MDAGKRNLNRLLFYPGGILVSQLFWPKAVSVFIILWALHLLWLRFTASGFFTIKWNHPFILLPAFYWLNHLLGLLYSDDLVFGLKDLETKLSFLLLPLFFFSSAQSLDLRWLKRFFIAAVLLSLLLCWMFSLNEFWNEVYARNHNIALQDYPYYNLFFSSYLSHFLHPGYFSMFLLMAIYFLSGEIKNNSRPREQISLISLLLFFLLSLVFLASKSGLIVAIISVPLLFFFGRKFTWREVTFGVLLLVFLTGFSFSLPWVRNSFSDALVSINHDQKPSADESSSSLRVISWKSALTLWKNNPLLGCGTGDVKNELVNLYLKQGHQLSAEKKLNAHSQILQSAAALGLPGLVLTLLLLLLPLRKGRSGAKFLAFLLVVFGFTESIFETQAGVIFYALMMPWICADENHID